MRGTARNCVCDSARGRQGILGGATVSALEKHPVFLTMQLVLKRTSDGTEIMELRERAQYYQLLQGRLDLCGLN